jgi:hypothetical protein
VTAEPGLDRPLAAHALDAPAALREPDVAQASAEQAALTLALGNDAERAEALVDGLGIDALAVVGANELESPAAQRGYAECAEGGSPCLQEVRVGRFDPELNAAALAPGGSDRRVGVRHELGDDLREVDPGLREVLAKVTSTDAAVAQLRGVDCHGQRISASDDGSRPATPLPCPCGSERKYKHDDDVAKELDRSSEN